MFLVLALTKESLPCAWPICDRRRLAWCEYWVSVHVRSIWSLFGGTYHALRMSGVVSGQWCVAFSWREKGTVPQYRIMSCSAAFYFLFFPSNTLNLTSNEVTTTERSVAITCAMWPCVKRACVRNVGIQYSACTRAHDYCHTASCTQPSRCVRRRAL